MEGHIQKKNVFAIAITFEMFLIIAGLEWSKDRMLFRRLLLHVSAELVLVIQLSTSLVV